MFKSLKDTWPWNRWEVAKLLKQAEKEENERREEQLLASFTLERSEDSSNRSTKITRYIPKGAISKPYDYNDPYSEELPDIQVTLEEKHNSNVENFMNVCNTFWRPSLTFNPFEYGDHLVDFGSLWPDEHTLETLMLEAYQATALRKCVLEICKLVLRCGPLRVLKTLVDRKIVSVDQVFENGSNMLHKASIAQNFDCVLFLLNAGINAKLQDKDGRIPYQVCHSSRVRRMLPAKSKLYLYKDSSTSVKPSSLHDRETIFQLAKRMENYDEIQIKLQTTDFDVNGEANNAGDYLVHICTREGISLFPQLMALVQIQGADIDLANTRGMTPLMIAAEMGDSFLTEVLICIIGANPNKPNDSNGWISLHYAAKNNNVDVLNCLIKRGADLNYEDKAGRRPDDIAALSQANDCMELLFAKRLLRAEHLSRLVEQGLLVTSQIRTSDLFSVDETGQNLIMTAAINNRVDILSLLVGIEGSPVDAQHAKNGRTALAMAAVEGHLEAVKILFSHGANPAIRDMNGDLPLHLAVKNSDNLVVLHLLQYTNTLTGLHRAWRLAQTSYLQRTIKSAMRRRQNYLVTPALFECSLTGNAEALYCLLEDGDRTNVKSGVGDWPLYLAAENGHLEVMKILYEFGGDVERRHPSTQNTVLHVAVTRGHYSVVEYLMEFCKVSGKNIPPMTSRISLYKEIDINAVNSTGKTALQIAAEKGNSRIVKLLLASGASTAILDRQGLLFSCFEYQGVQVLIEMTRSEHLHQIIKCVEEGSRALSRLKAIWQLPFDHNLVNSDGDTVLMVACRLGKLEVVKFLLESAVYENNIQCFELYSDESEVETEICEELQSLSTIDEASDSGHLTELTESLQSCGQALAGQYPDLLCTNVRGEIVTNGNLPLIDQENSMINSQTVDMSALRIRDENIHTQSVELEFSDLYRQGGEASEGNMDSMSMLQTFTQQFSNYYSAGNRNVYYHGSSNISHVCAANSKTGFTAAHYAVQYGSLSILIALIEADKNCINIQDKAGLTPLHLACKIRRKKIAEKLISLDFVDLNSRTLEGNLPEEMTRSKTLVRLISNARQQTSDSLSFSPITSQVSTTAGSVYSAGGSSIDFEKINSRFIQMKQKLMSKEFYPK